MVNSNIQNRPTFVKQQQQQQQQKTPKDSPTYLWLSRYISQALRHKHFQL